MARIEAATLERAARREASDEAERKATAEEKERWHELELSGQSSDLTFEPVLLAKHRSRSVLPGGSAGACAPPLSLAVRAWSAGARGPEARASGDRRPGPFFRLFMPSPLLTICFLPQAPIWK